MMAIRRLLKELDHIRSCEKEGLMPVPCRISIHELNFFHWNASFDINVNGVVTFDIVFPSDYPFRPPAITTSHPKYKLYSICLGDWTPYITAIYIISHIYLSITSLSYYMEHLPPKEPTSSILNAQAPEFHPSSFTVNSQKSPNILVDSPADKYKGTYAGSHPVFTPSPDRELKEPEPKY